MLENCTEIQLLKVDFCLLKKLCLPKGKYKVLKWPVDRKLQDKFKQTNSESFMLFWEMSLSFSTLFWFLLKIDISKIRDLSPKIDLCVLAQKNLIITF